ncbi:methyltransferase isoform X2 [Wolffia australiana]
MSSGTWPRYCVCASMIELFNGRGAVVEGCIDSIDRTGVNFLASEEPKLVNLKSIQWHVFAAFGSLKGGRGDWLVEKCTELGASSITPLLTERSSSMADNRIDRLHRVVLAAKKQCQRLDEMKLNPPVKIQDLLPLITGAKVAFVAVAGATPLCKTFHNSRLDAGGLIIIGPEGDFTEKEVEMMTQSGVTAVGLGPCRLRVETAAIALLSSLMLFSDAEASHPLLPQMRYSSQE